MSVAHLYCQGACAACSTLRHSLVAHGVDVETHDVTTDPRAYDTVIALGYRSLPVLVSSEGTAAGSRAGALARRLTSSVEAPAHSHLHRGHGPLPTDTSHRGADTQALADQDDEARHTWYLASKASHPKTTITATNRAVITATSRKEQS